jgi:hypothetical protein
MVGDVLIREAILDVLDKKCSTGAFFWPSTEKCVVDDLEKVFRDQLQRHIDATYRLAVRIETLEDAARAVDKLRIAGDFSVATPRAHRALVALHDALAAALGKEDTA